MIYNWLVKQEKELCPYQLDSIKGKVVWYMLRYVYGRRYWKDVLASAVSKLKAQHERELQRMRKREIGLLTAYISLSHPEEKGICYVGNQPFIGEDEEDSCTQNPIFEMDDRDFLKRYGGS